MGGHTVLISPMNPPLQTPHERAPESVDVRVGRSVAVTYGDNRADSPRTHGWLKDLASSHTVPVCVLDVLKPSHGKPSDFRFVSVSPAFAMATGLEEAVGRRMRELRPDFEELWFALFERIARTGKPEIFCHEAHSLHRSFWGNAFRVGAPGAWQVVVVFEECSAEEVALRMQKQFALALDDHSFQRGEAPVEEFVATIAHELRSPLAPLRSGLQIMRLAAGNDAVVHRTLEMMERQLTQLTNLVGDLMDVGRISAAKVEMHRKPIELREVVAASVEACADSMQSRHHDVTVESDGDVVVEGDPQRLTQVFSNLLSNSAKYTEPGGHIRISLERRDGMAVARVIDDGLGIAQDELHEVFDLFAQVRRHRSRADGGLGIGLSIVQNLVRLHGGTVEAHSAGPGQGTTFTVRLPLCRPARAQCPSSAEK